MAHAVAHDPRAVCRPRCPVGNRFNGSNTASPVPHANEAELPTGWWSTYRQRFDLGAEVRRGKTSTRMGRWSRQAQGHRPCCGQHEHRRESPAASPLTRFGVQRTAAMNRIHVPKRSITCLLGLAVDSGASHQQLPSCDSRTGALDEVVPQLARVLVRTLIPMRQKWATFWFDISCRVGVPGIASPATGTIPGTNEHPASKNSKEIAAPGTMPGTIAGSSFLRI